MNVYSLPSIGMDVYSIPSIGINGYLVPSIGMNVYSIHSIGMHVFSIPSTGTNVYSSIRFRNYFQFINCNKSYSCYKFRGSLIQGLSPEDPNCGQNEDI